MERKTRKKKLGGYPAVGVVISITLALFVMGLFGMLVLYSLELEKQVRENIKMQVYLRPHVTEAQRLQIQNTLRAKEYVNAQAAQPIIFVSKEEAAEKFIAETGEDFKKFLGENPLRDAFLVTLNAEHARLEEMEKIKADIQKMNGVFQVFYVEGLIESVNSNVTKIGLILLGMIVILLITVILLINNTLRIALFSQRFLIRSMQLVGAKRGFIQWPFLLRAIGYGFLAGLLAGGLLFALINYAQQKISDLVTLHDPSKFFILIGILTLTGITIAFISTFFSIRRYLRMSLDDLY